MTSPKADPASHPNQKRRRSLWAAGLVYLAFMMAFDAAGRAGITEGIPVLGWTVQGPFTALWVLGSLIKHCIATALFVFIMSRFLPKAPETSEPGISR